LAASIRRRTVSQKRLDSHEVIDRADTSPHSRLTFRRGG
jgi:hypothetical protein